MPENTNIIEIISKEQFDEAIKSEKLTIVDFWADWCGPCRMLKPILHKIADENKEIQLLTVDVDLEENRDLTLEYEINSIPHVYFFKDGEKVYDFTGVMPENEILEKIEASK